MNNKKSGLELFSVLIINIISAYSVFLLKEKESFSIILQIIIFVLALAVVVVFTKTNKSGLKKLLLVFLLLGFYGLFIEYLSIKTGFPYSKFEYGDNMGYKIAGIVPYSVFLIWPSLVIAAISFSQIFSSSIRMRLLISAIILIMLDLVFDPAATKMGLWLWYSAGNYYDVPWINFLGWGFSSTISVLLFYLFFRKLIQNKYLNYIFLGNLLIWTVMCLLMRLEGPFMIGSSISIYSMFKLCRSYE